MYKTDDYPFHFIPAPLLLWYQKNKRALPWRENPTPYRVWVSEIMLQQTRVEAAREYYLRFMRELPDVYALASCEEDRLMKLWEGLGYYSRARNLQKAARIVAEEYGGKFPEDEKGLRALPGVGKYTAGAVLSIAFGKRQCFIKRMSHLHPVGCKSKIPCNHDIASVRQRPLRQRIESAPSHNHRMAHGDRLEMPHICRHMAKQPANSPI